MKGLDRQRSQTGQPQGACSAQHSLTTADGLRLNCRQWNASHPLAACIIVHGLGEHSGRYDLLAQELVSRSLSVWTVDLRGHGRSEGRRTDCRSFSEFDEDLLLLVEHARGFAPDVPRILIGHSLGGLLALRFAADHPELIRAVAATSPAIGLSLKLPRFKVALVTQLAHWLPTTPIPNNINPHILCRDPHIVSAYQKDPLVHHFLTARCALALQDAIHQAPSLAEKIKVPCLILQAGNDQVCDSKASAQFVQAAKQASATFRVFDGFYHEVFNEPERTQVIEELCQWIQQQLR